MQHVHDHPNVMISSTFHDLVEHREAARDAAERLGFFAVIMERDSARAGRDVIDSSLQKVDVAVAYVGILSHRYGGVPEDPERNPDSLSATELEYRRAVERGIPAYVFIMSKEHPVKVDDVELDPAKRAKLEAFKADARDRSICAEFSSVPELKAALLQSLVQLRDELTQSKPPEERGGRRGPIPTPPELYALPHYIPGHDFVGRAAELSWLDDWLRSDDAVLVVEAIGGMGKSMLAWQWVRSQAPPDLEGVLWYSFYEGGADMSAFAAHALAYLTGRDLDEFRGRRTGALEPELIAELREQPCLLVLDGLERVLVAYHRIDASQTRDDQVSSGSEHRACIKPQDAELLRRLVGASPSRTLITTRLLPTALTNKSGRPLPGVRRRKLSGLDPQDALRMMEELGVRGSSERISRYLRENFGNHPLVVGIVAGLVSDYRRAPGDFDRWADDPQGGAELNLSELDLSQRRTHILAAALRGLEPDTRQTLSRIAALPDAVPFETVAALNPFRSQPEGSRGPLEHGGRAVSKLVDALHELEARGLLQWDRPRNTYDLHPVVRGYAFDLLEDNERNRICMQIVNHFESGPGDRYEDARTLADVQRSLTIFRALVAAGRLEEAAALYTGDFAEALAFSLEARHETWSLLKAVLPRRP